jgi:signal transduction histidine kinase
MSHLPIRWKLTLAFALALTAVLTAAGIFLYAQVRADVDEAIEHDLRLRADQLSGLLIRSPDTALAAPHHEDLDPDETIAQVVTPDGRVVAASSHADVTLLTPEQRQVAASRELFIDRTGDAMHGESLRIFASPVQTPRGTYIIVVTDSLDERAETLASTLGVEVVGLSAALLASCGVGYWIAGLALRPVEVLRQRAAAISGDDLAEGEREPLPVSEVDDEIGRLGRTLNDMLDRIGRAQTAQRDVLERLRRFLADASHQLRTPLAIIKTEVELAQSDVTKGDELRASMASIEEETDRLSRLTDQLLLLAAADEERLSLNFESVDVRDLLAEAADRGQGRAQLEGRTIMVQSDDSVITADRLRLEYALGNLMDNALIHGAGNVELTARQAGGAVEITVRDNGPGFSDSYVAHPFERFAPTASTGRGTGLGLAIVQAITEAHGGAVVLANDHGATVTLALPINQARPVASPDSGPTSPATATDQERQWSAH